MNDATPSRYRNESPRAYLSDRITGIVFWGLVLVGMGLAAYDIHQYENGLQRLQESNTRSLGTELEHWLRNHPERDLTRIGQYTAHLLDKYQVAGLVIADGRNKLLLGDVDGTAARAMDIALPAAGSNEPRRLQVTLYPVSDRTLVSEYRKRVLGLMGIVLAVFGLLLNWILRRLLSQPFDSMLRTALDILRGDRDRRFPEARDDEFGFLARFINQALDDLTDKQNELRGALEREREADTALQEEKERLEVTLNSIADAVITTNQALRIEYLNPVAEKMTGWPLDQARGHIIDDVLVIETEAGRERLMLPVIEAIHSGRPVQSEGSQVLVHRDGSSIHIENSAAPIRDHAGHIIGSVMVIQDVGANRQLTRELSHQATHDALTGLCNRREFEVQLEQAIQSARIQKTEHVLCYMDLDQFKIVNDTCGHIAGDELLRQLSGLLHEQVRDTDLLARLGGDEFGLLLKHCPIDKAFRIAESLRESVNDFRFVWEERSFEIGVSVGLVSINGDSRNLTEVLSTADMACYAAKDSGRNRLMVHTPGDIEIRQRRTEMQWVSEIHRALHEDSFELFIQPVLSFKTNRTDHYEVLLRLRNEDRQLVTPGTFMTAAERYNLVVDIDRWVLRNVLDREGERIRKQLVALNSGAGSPPTLAINLSGASLTDSKFAQYLTELLESGSLPARYICFEIIETAAISNLSTAKDFITVFKKMGCRFALDDFGSGMSSFAYLKNLPVDFLKIDGSYVKDIVSDPMDRALVESVNQIGHVLGMKTIAEFVEDEQILQALLEIGIDCAQGVHISRPLPLRNWLETERNSRTALRIVTAGNIQ